MRHALEPGDLAHAARRPSKKSRRRIKKRHVERVTRLPTKRMATACWDFIVARTTPRETAPLLDFFSLRVTNKRNSSTCYQQRRSGNFRTSRGPWPVRTNLNSDGPN